MATPKKMLLAAGLLLALALGALGGVNLPAFGHGSGAVPAAYADDCTDNNPPPPGVTLCNPTPTPTPPK